MPPVRLISHPFRLLPGGDVATVLEGTDEADAEQLAILVLTRKGERQLVPRFGVRDPAFSGLDLAEINAGLAQFGPPVSATSLDVTYPSPETARAVIAFR